MKGSILAKGSGFILGGRSWGGGACGSWSHCIPIEEAERGKCYFSLIYSFLFSLRLKPWE